MIRKWRYKMEINGKTTICAVIGDPIGHTMSPTMHNAAYRALGLNFAYVAFHVKNVRQAVQGVLGLGIRGLSVTIPHKIEIMQYMDETSPLARKIGAMNTVINDNGRLLGTNTDAHGTLKAIETLGDPNGKNVVILGVGGSARAAAFALACERNPSKLVLAARNADKAQTLACEIAQHTSVPLHTVSFGPTDLAPVFEQADFIINTTPVGMSPKVEECLIPEELFSPRHAVFDMIYNPAETLLLRRAKARGAQVVNGVPMFVHQGAEQFRLWTGHEPPIAAMQEAVEKALGHR